MTKTLEYYNNNAETFISGTKDVGFSEIQMEFVRNLPDGAKILDLGCGAGRDSKAFMDMGFSVVPADGSKELCRLTGEYLGIPVKHMMFDELDEKEEYDGIWACASLLHVEYEELPHIMSLIENALKQGGVFYCSFKYGDFEGERNGRFFTDMNKDRWNHIRPDGLNVQKIWITEDVRPGRSDEKWFNVIAVKE